MEAKVPQEDKAEKEVEAKGVPQENKVEEVKPVVEDAEMKDVPAAAATAVEK